MNENRIVAVATFNVSRETFSEVADDLKRILETRAPHITGYLRSMLLTNETKAHIVCVTEWTSRQSWAEAQWDEEIGRTVAELFEATASYDVECFYPLFQGSRDAAT
jgi:heme-degrading monooxygenase HmoA